MPLPNNYVERVYAGVLGKIIGVYLGRPFEGWSYERIMAELGEVDQYVHQRFGVPLVVTDDDISGTFTFLRAMPDYDNTPEITPAQIGQTWLNYIIERQTILWWGGMGNSTEHTAFLRLKQGIPAPQSGSIQLNGKVVAEQIGSQIFIDSWAMIVPGDPERAADFAKRAASVSHDGEAIYGAQVIAAMEAQAFVEPDLQQLLDTALRFIPANSVIARLIHDLRTWRNQTNDWRVARQWLEQHYGYQIYGGNCHMVPNHGVILLALLYGDDDFRRSLMIANTAGWDTDCNSGNVGCLLGIKNGLATIDTSPYDWRGPVADRLYLPTADGGRSISDAVIETYEVVNIGRILAGMEPLAPKNGARFHFEAPGSVQGFLPSTGLTLQNQCGQDGSRNLRLQLGPDSYSGQAATATFIPQEAIIMHGYALLAAPTLVAGQTVRARIVGDQSNPAAAACTLFIRSYTTDEQLIQYAGPSCSLLPGQAVELIWPIPTTDGQPIAEIGLTLEGTPGTAVALDFLTWDGEPDLTYHKPATDGSMWRRAWVAALDEHTHSWPEAFRVIQNIGRGMLMTGTRQWRNYTMETIITPHMCDSFGVAIRVQGLQRAYCLSLSRGPAGLGIARIIKLRDGEQILAEAPFDWSFGHAYTFQFQASGARLTGTIGEQAGPQVALTVMDEQAPLSDGGIALIVEAGRIATDSVFVHP